MLNFNYEKNVPLKNGANQILVVLTKNGNTFNGVAKKIAKNNNEYVQLTYRNVETKRTHLKNFFKLEHFDFFVNHLENTVKGGEQKTVQQLIMAVAEQRDEEGTVIKRGTPIDLYLHREKVVNPADGKEYTNELWFYNEKSYHAYLDRQTEADDTADIADL